MSFFSATEKEVSSQLLDFKSEFKVAFLPHLF